MGDSGVYRMPSEREAMATSPHACKRTVRPLSWVLVGGGYGFLADYWACGGNSSGRRNVGDSAGAAMWGGLIKGVSSSSTPMGCRKLILVSHTTPSQTRGFRFPHGSPRQPPSLVFPKGSGRGFSLLLCPHDPSFFGLWPHLSSSWLHFHRALSPVSP